MSRNDEPASDAEPDAPITDSVFDFLYHDARRVGSFLAQIDLSGHLTSLKQTETAESGSGAKFNASASGTIAVAKGGASMEDQRTTTEREAMERTYDPYWTNALALIDMLDERGMIRDGLATARIGQFVKVSGSLVVMDLTLWKGLWSLPALKQVLTENAAAEQQANQAGSEPVNRASRRRDKAVSKRQAPSTVLEHQMEAALALIGMLPHTVQARLITENDESVWCSLREEGLVVSASDLTLKHGITVSGQLTMLGVLDALPEVDAQGIMTDAALESAVISAVAGASPFGELMVHLTPAIRGLLGRPTNAYGLTPLVIFRQIAA